MTTKIDQVDARIREFVGVLTQLDVGARARLRRNAGRTLGNARDVHSVFFQALPYGVATRDEDTYFQIATLFSISRQEKEGKGSFGAALRRIRPSRRDDERANSLDRRFQALLASEADQLSFRLRQLVRLIASRDVAIDWEQLLYDLLHWDTEDRWVQLKWARDYFVGRPRTAEPESQDAEFSVFESQKGHEQ